MKGIIAPPYKAGPDDRRSHYPTIHGSDDNEVCMVVGETKTEAVNTRDFIVRACNHHDSLVEHLAKTTAALQTACANLAPGVDAETAGRLYAIRIIAERALAHAMEEKP